MTNLISKTLHLAIFLAILVGCGAGGDKGDDSDVTAQPDEYMMTLDFIRLTSGTPNPFQVVVTITKNSLPLVGQAGNLAIELEKGTAGSVSETSSGVYEFTVTPTQTGEHSLTVSIGETAITRTPIVLNSVHPEWGQPMAVEGDVNTAGYEDGVTISPDGQYLFVQTGPYRWSSLLVFNEPTANGGCGGNRLSPTRCEHEWVNQTMGTYTAPERPLFFSGRFSGTTQLHNAASWGVDIDEAPNYAITTMFYGFKRQPDGSFKNPFYMAFNDLNDGIIGPYGLSFLKNNDGTHTIIFSLRDAVVYPDSFDVYTYTAMLGTNINLGDYEFSSSGNPPNRGSYFPSTLVDFGSGNEGTQGNPFLYCLPDGTINSIWVDDEYDEDGDYHKLSVHTLDSGLFPSTGVWSKAVLPSPVNRGQEAIQPTFVGDGLYFTENTNIVFSAYSGGTSVADYSTSANWAIPEYIITKDTSPAAKCRANCSQNLGKIVAVGEPTIAEVDGNTVLYFVYAYIRGYDQTATGWFDLDFQAGYIEKN